jgi:hypothetical protein
VRQLAFALRVILLTCAILGSVPGMGQTAPGLPDVDVVLIADVQDTAGWLTLHQEVLSTPATSKMLRVTLPARTGGSRSIDIEQPRFTVGLVTTKEGKGQVKVTVAGKLPASLALVVVTPFQQAAMEIHAGWVTNDISLAYGLSLVKGRLLELYFDRP